MNRSEKSTTTVNEEAERRRADCIWLGRAARLFCLLCAVLAVYLLLRRGIALLLPFLLAMLLSVPIRRGARLLHKTLRVPLRLGAILLLLLVLLLLVSLLTLLLERLIFEAQRLLDALQQNGGDVSRLLEQALDFFTRITAHIPPLRSLLEQQSLESFWQQVDATVATLISDTLTRWSGKIPEAIGSLLRSLPSLLLFVLTFLIAALYCCTDDGRIAAFLHDATPPLWRDRLLRLRACLADAGVRYLRAYLLLFLLTFVQLYVGFSILGLDYTFLPALLLSLVDILPVLGVGTVLVPWGIVALWQGNTFVGTGLLVLFGIMLLSRQLLEPRILGGSLGLHPLATLFAVYTGLRLCGVPGMIVAPAVAMVLKGFLGKPKSTVPTK